MVLAEVEERESKSQAQGGKRAPSSDLPAEPLLNPEPSPGPSKRDIKGVLLLGLFFSEQLGLICFNVFLGRKQRHSTPKDSLDF